MGAVETGVCAIAVLDRRKKRSSVVGHCYGQHLQVQCEER